VSGATAPFFAIVLDLSLPGMPPAELMPALRAACPGAPIVLTSGHDEEEALLRIGEPAHSAFLQKPFTPDELLAALRDATGG
jgi:DNA-binding NarL/FixJ family response regulator